MSYTTQDRYNVPLHSYDARPSQVSSAGTGKTWWPDFGPNIRDFSFQENCEPSSYHFRKDVRRAPSDPPKSQLGIHSQAASSSASELRSFRRPAAPGSDPESRRRWGKDTTAKQGRLNMLEKRQKVMDSWIAPVEKPIDELEDDSTNSKGQPKTRLEGDLRGSRRISEEASAEPSEELRPMPSLDSETWGLPCAGLVGGKSWGMRSAVELSYRPAVVREAYRKAGDMRFYGSSPKPAKLPQGRYVLDPATSLPVPRVVAHLGPRGRLRQQSAPARSTLSLEEGLVSLG